MWFYDETKTEKELNDETWDSTHIVTKLFVTYIVVSEKSVVSWLLNLAFTNPNKKRVDVNRTDNTVSIITNSSLLLLSDGLWILVRPYGYYTTDLTYMDRKSRTVPQIHTITNILTCNRLHKIDWNVDRNRFRKNEFCILL